MDKGLIFDIRRYSVHDGPGIRTTVFFKGCPLNCLWCHNPESIGFDPQSIGRVRNLNGRSCMVDEVVGKTATVDDVMREILKDRLFFEESGGGVTFSGGEPLAQPAFLNALLEQCAGAGLHTALDTSGYAPPEVFLQACSRADVLLFDIKSANREKHIRHAGVDNVPLIDNLLALTGDGPCIYIRVPVIPGFNNTLGDMLAIAEIAGRIRARVEGVDLLPFHRLGRQKYEALSMVLPPAYGPDITDGEMDELMHVFSAAGFRVKKGG